jgi:nucleoside transporter
MQTGLKAKLSAFMFLQYFIWGSWYVSMGTYLANRLKFGGQEIGAAYGAFAIGSMISPFFVGLIADRYFASEKLLAALGVLSGIVMCALPQMTQFSSFYPGLILYCALFAPTLALGNSLSLHHLRDSKRDFPRVKTLSAVGWIAGGVTLSALKGEQSATQFYLAGAASVAFGLFALTLPHTPPKKLGTDVSVGEILGLDALGLMRKPAFAVFIGCLFLICIPLYFYFVNMAIYLTELQWPNIAGRMTLAQVSDVIFLMLLPVMLKRLGYKVTIGIGILAWVTRYFLLAGSVNSAGAAQSALIFAAIVLHGVCYDFLFIAGQLYVDDAANERMRGAAQGFIAFILWGLGAFFGTMLAGRVLAAHKLATAVSTIEHDWRGIWLTPAYLASGVLVVFLIFFRSARPAAAALVAVSEDAAGVAPGPL